MCGHVGVAGTMTTKDVDIFNTLLYLDTLRGPHSTGVAAVNRNSTNREIDLFKRVGPAYYVQESKQYDKVATVGKSVLIGHNRYATVGKVSNANAHPFEFSNIVGAHNGTIPWSSRSDILDYNKFDTDSEGIFNMINELGPELTIPELFGAWALVWYDKRDHALHMLRNEQRELCWTYSESRQTLYYASEAWMLYAAMGRHNVTPEKIWMLTPDQHHVFKIPDTHGAKMEDPETSRLEGRKTEKYVHTASSAFQGSSRGSTSQPGTALAKVGEVTELPFDDDVPFGDRDADSDAQTKTTASLQWAGARVRTHRKGKRDQRQIPVLIGYGGKELNETNYRQQTGECCSLCDDVVPFGSIYTRDKRVKFINPRQFICEECALDPWAVAWYEEDDKVEIFMPKRKLH